MGRHASATAFVKVTGRREFRIDALRQPELQGRTHVILGEDDCRMFNAEEVVGERRSDGAVVLHVNRLVR
jgi:hypothetical protein